MKSLATIGLVAMVALVALAGCLGGGDDDASSDDTTTGADGAGGGAGGDNATASASDAPRTADDALFGWVLDAAIRPLEGAQIRVLETNDVAIADAEGGYRFSRLPVEQTLVLVATLDGYEALSKQVTLPQDGAVRLNFTLTPEPTEVAYMDVLEFQGFLACETSVILSQQETYYDCSAGESQAVWDFAVGPDLAGAVIEVAWEASSDAARSLRGTLETLGLGEANEVLGDTVGTSMLRLNVPSAAAERFYQEGGRLRLTVEVEPAVDEEEANTGAGVAVQQEFEAFASLFYVEGPAGDYSIAG